MRGIGHTNDMHPLDYSRQARVPGDDTGAGEFRHLQRISDG
jgi:hypothetical protein